MRFCLFVFEIVALTAIVAAQCPKYNFKVVLKAAKYAHQLKGAVKEYQRLLGGVDNLSFGGPFKDGFRQVRFIHSLHTN